MTTFRESKFALIAGASAVALGAPAGTALGQEEPVATTGDEDQAERGQRRLDSVTVTATRREEGVQDIPIAVTALNPQTLERAGVQDIQSLETLSASFNLNTSQTESQGAVLRIRGVGTTGNNIGLESAVGVFLDGVYLSRPGIALGDLLDLEQLEVLRGPQGTLFGRNVTAGALNIKTKKPNLSEREAFADFTYGNFEAFNTQAGVSLPLIEDKLAVRLSGAYRERDGFLESTQEGAESGTRERWLFRSQLQYEPTSDFSLRLIGDVSSTEDQCCDAVLINEGAFAETFTTLNAATGMPEVIEGGAFAFNGLPGDGGAPRTGVDAFEDRVSNGEQFENPSDQWGISGEINWDIGLANLTYIGSYREFKAESVQESDFVGLDLFSTGGSTATPGTPSARATFDDIDTMTHELRAQGNAFDDRLDWLVGFYYSEEDIFEQQVLSLGSDFQQAISANFIPLIGSAAGPNPALLFATQFDPVTGAPVAPVDAAGSFAVNEFTQNQESFSFFTHNTFAVTDKADFTFGLRYVDESKDGKFEQPQASSPACLSVAGNAANPPAALAPLADLFPLATALTCFPFATEADVPGTETFLPNTFDEEFNDEELVWTVKGGYEFTPTIRGYVSASHGFKAGGFNLDATAAIGDLTPQFDSETINAYEIGVKSELFDGRLRANLAAFHQDITDFQVLEFTGVQFVTFNVDEALSTGLELETEAVLGEYITANMALTYTDARYPDDCAPASAPAQVRNLCGADLTNAPEFVGIWGATYERNIPRSDLKGFLTGSVRYASDKRVSTQPTFVGTDVEVPFGIQDDNAKLNLRLGVGRQDDRWTLEFWGTNITDEQTTNNVFNIPLRGGSFLLPVFGNDAAASQARGAFIQAPRTYGVTLRTQF